MQLSAKAIGAMIDGGKIPVAQAASLAMCGQKTVRAWCRAGKVASQVSRGMLFVDVESLKKWIGEKQ
jgi:hypothetical protein